MIVDLISFSFSRNKPLEANYIIDVRFLNNPFYVDKLRTLTGLDIDVIKFFEDDRTAKSFLNKLSEWVKYIIELNKKANKEKITIAVGCTGGQHRSPYIVEYLAKYLNKKKLADELTVYHRELSKYNIGVEA